MIYPDAVAAQLHCVLLRAAGWLPDEVLADARTRLAGGRLGEVAASIAFAGARTVLPLTEHDLDLVEDVLRAEDLNTDGAARIELTTVDRLPVWRIVADLDADEHDATPDPGTVDEALLAALAGEPIARGAWRAWRLPAEDVPYPPPAPIYVVETDGHGDLPALADRLARVVAAAGLAPPLVEVTAPDMDVPDYQRMARSAGHLLWTAEPAPEIGVALVFDSVAPEIGPSFAPDHPLLTDVADREDVLAYLRSGTELFTTMATLDDVVEPDRGPVVPMSFRTDGVWVWSDATTYYLDEYLLAPDSRLLAHIRGSDRPQRRVDAVALHHARVALATPPEPEDADALTRSGAEPT